MLTRPRGSRGSRRWVVPLAIAAAVAVLAVAGGAGATPRHADGWSTGTLAGRWGFSAAGTIAPPAVPAPVPADAAGTMEFDGNGGCRIADTIDAGGTAYSRVSTSCRYSVEADGRGTLVAEFPDEPAPVPLSFVIDRHGSELRFIRADAVVASGVAERQ